MKTVITVMITIIIHDDDSKTILVISAADATIKIRIIILLIMLKIINEKVQMNVIKYCQNIPVPIYSALLKGEY